MENAAKSSKIGFCDAEHHSSNKDHSSDNEQYSSNDGDSSDNEQYSSNDIGSSDNEQYSSREDIYGDDSSVENETVAVYDVEAYDFECLSCNEADMYFKAKVKELSDKLHLQDDGEVLILLLHYKWDVSQILEEYKQNSQTTLIQARVRVELASEVSEMCSICFQELQPEECRSLGCCHQFCVDCWKAYLEVQIENGRSTDITCMSQNCDILISFEFVLALFSESEDKLRNRYLQLSLDACVRSHPFLRYCPGKNCQTVIKVKESLTKRVICSQCRTQFCFRCAGNYHAPVDCETMKNWYIEASDDNKVELYMADNTKICPQCKSRIEKSGGCNRMICIKCKHRFCWICLRDARDPHDCNNFENMSLKASNEEMAKTRYAFYYKRWKIHSESLRLEEKTRENMEFCMNNKVTRFEKTSNEQQYLKDAADILVKCRHTLPYTYVYAYYMKHDHRKKLFEYQQGLLEREVENLSAILHRPGATRGALRDATEKVEKLRSALLNDFLNA